jgi:hypothetical protein
VFGDQLLGVVLADPVASSCVRSNPCVVTERFRDGDHGDANPTRASDSITQRCETRRDVDGRHAVTDATT